MIEDAKNQPAAVYLPQFSKEEQTSTQRWDAVRWAIGAGASDRAVPSQDLAQLQLRYIAGEIDQAQVHDELLRWSRPDIALEAAVRLLPSEQHSRVYSYATEMADLMVEMNDLPPYVPYTVMEEGIPWLE